MMHEIKKTKIVCTIGPASESTEMIEALAKEGMNIVRFNFSHDVQANHLARMKRVREVSDRIGTNLSILLDTKGPEIRCGDIEGGAVEFAQGDIVRVGFDADYQGNKDRFTSSREGVISDDPLFQSVLLELEKIMKIITDDWDKWRVELRQDGDSENITRMTKKERKSKELVNIISDEFVPTKESTYRSKVDEWIDSLSNDAEFNVTTYAECFMSENLLRNYINHKPVPLSEEAVKESERWKNIEERNKNKANISFDLRQSEEELVYLNMDDLANLIEKVDSNTQAGLSRDAKEYKPIRDAVAHTALLTDIAKKRLNLTYENIKARIKKLLE